MAERTKANETTLRIRAKAEEERAADEAARSAHVASSLRSVLQSVSPKAALGRNSVHAILTEIEKRLETEFREQPVVLAELRDTLGTLYQDIGDYPRAIVCHRIALAQRRMLFGDRHADVATSLDRLGVALQLNFDLDEAKRMLREALDLRRTLFGADHADVAPTMSDLSIVLSHQTRLRESHRDRRDRVGPSGRMFGLSVGVD